MPSVVPERELAARTGAQVRRLEIGLAASFVGVLAAAVVSVSFVAWTSRTQAWPLVLVMAEILLSAVCGLQWWVWRLARAHWMGRWEGQIGALVGTSRAGTLLAWVAAIGACLSAVAVGYDAGWSLPGGAAVLTVVATLVALVFGSSQYLRLDGPADTVGADDAAR